VSLCVACTAFWEEVGRDRDRVRIPDGSISPSLLALYRHCGLLLISHDSGRNRTCISAALAPALPLGMEDGKLGWSSTKVAVGMVSPWWIEDSS
jgi:hypothetical protein